MKALTFNKDTMRLATSPPEAVLRDDEIILARGHYPGTMDFLQDSLEAADPRFATHSREQISPKILLREKF